MKPARPENRAVGVVPTYRIARLGLGALALLLFAVPIGWGATNSTTQAPDEVRPKDVREAEHRSFSDGWATPYPPLIYYVLSTTYSVAEHVGLDRVPKSRAHVIAGRAVSVLLAVATVLLVAALGMRLELAGGALLAAVFWLASPTVTYYAKTTNVESLYLFFLVLALFCLVRFRAERRGVFLVASASAAVLSVASKDQAGVYFLAAPVLALAVLVERERARGAGRWPALASALVDRVNGITIAVTAALAIGVLNVATNLEGLKEHYRIVGRQPDLYVEHSSDVVGYLELGWSTLLNLHFVVGLPAILLAIVGIAVLARDRRRLSLHREHLLCGSVYLLFFWAFVPRSYDRFVLPVALSLVLLAGVGWERGVAPRLSRAVRVGLLAALAFVSLARAVELDLRMLYDSRQLVGEWIERDGGGPKTTWVLGSSSWSPLVGTRVRTGTPGRMRESLRRWAPRHLVAESALLTAPEWRSFFAPQGYEEVWRSSGPIPRRFSSSIGALTNLDKVSPELVVLRRAD